jgi:hypothetical protein
MPAPPREALIKFGGYMTIEAFRSNATSRITFDMPQLPFLPI